MARRRGARALAVAAGLLLIALTACTSEPAPDVPSTPSTAPPTDSTIAGIWITGKQVNSPDTPFLHIEDDGTWNGSDGCNGVEGTWTIDSDGTLSVQSGLHTLIYCDGEPLPSSFANATMAIIQSGQLQLLDTVGQPLVVLKRTDSVPLEARGTAEVTGWWGSKDLSSPHPVFVELTADGKVQGNDGCNNFTGEWKFAENGSVAFTPFAATLKACPNYTPWLTNATSGLVDGNVLVATNSLGLQIGILQRSPVPSATPSPTVGAR